MCFESYLYLPQMFEVCSKFPSAVQPARKKISEYVNCYKDEK